MYVSRIAIGLFSTVLGCRQFSHWVTAFGRSPLHHSRLSPSKLSVALESADEEGLNASREDLLDEAVLLYSVVSQRTKFNDNTEAEHDILNLRGNELTSLIEDAVFDARGILRDGVVGEDDIVEVRTTAKEPETLVEISHALDDQILLGYEASFTEEELEEWVGRINNLQTKLQSKLAALPPASDDSLSTAAPQPPPMPLDRIHVRLESMRTLIDPESSSRLRLPLAQPVVVAVVSKPKPIIQISKESVNTPAPSVPASPKSNTETKGATENDNNSEKTIETQPKDECSPEDHAPSEIDIENAFIESINKAAESRSAAVPTKIETEDMKSTNESVDDSVIEQVVPALPPLETKIETKSTIEIENPLTGDSLIEKTVMETEPPTKLEIENAFIEAVNKAAEIKNAASVSGPNAFIDAVEKATVLKSTVPSTVQEDSDDESDQASHESLEVDSQDDTSTLNSVNDSSSDKAETDLTPSADSITLNVDDSQSNEAEISLTEESNTAVTNNSTAANDGEAEPPSEVSTGIVQHNDDADVVSSVVTAAVLGTAAITKLPLLVAGVALGPVIRDSITIAKSRMKDPSKPNSKKKAKPKPKAILGFKPKTRKKKMHKPKARSAFDPKFQNKVAEKKKGGRVNNAKENDDMHIDLDAK